MDLGFFHTPKSTQTHMSVFLTGTLLDRHAESWAIWCSKPGGGALCWTKVISRFKLRGSELVIPDHLEGGEICNPTQTRLGFYLGSFYNMEGFAPTVINMRLSGFRNKLPSSALKSEASLGVWLRNCRYWGISRQQKSLGISAVSPG